MTAVREGDRLESEVSTKILGGKNFFVMTEGNCIQNISDLHNKRTEGKQEDRLTKIHFIEDETKLCNLIPEVIMKH